MGSNNNGGDGGAMMIVVLMSVCMIMCCSSALSVWISVNEGIIENSALDWMKWSDYPGLGLSTGDTTTTDGGDDSSPGGGGDAKYSKYKENCVYMYDSKDGKKGSIEPSICVDEKDDKKYWEHSKIHNLSGLRVGKEVVASIIDRNRDAIKRINGSDAEKVVELPTEWDNKAGGISVEYKKYKSSGKLDSVGGNLDEDCVYFYGDTKAKAYVGHMCPKSKSKSDVFNHAWSKQISSMRIGKKVEIKYTTSAGATKDLSGNGVSKVVEMGSDNDSIVKIEAWKKGGSSKYTEEQLAHGEQQAQILQNMMS